MADETPKTPTPTETSAPAPDQSPPTDVAPMPGEPEPAVSVRQEAVTAAEHIGEAAAETAAADVMRGQSDKAVEDGVDAAEEEADILVPPLAHAGWASLKAWIRREIEYTRLGHSEETRQQINP